MDPCPTREQLQHLLAENLSPAAVEELEKHLGGCAACQAALEELTRDPAPDRIRQPPAPGTEAKPSWLNRLAAQPLTDAVAPPNPGTAPKPSPAASTALHVAGYTILEELGRGGMGVVYKARQLALNRTVALKMILAGAHADAAALARFRREADAIARFQHPNIIQIHEIGEQDGLPYLCLEYVDGVNLAHFAAGRPQPARLAADLLATLARAVHFAHQQGIIHRDLKPANILLSRGAQSAASTILALESSIPKIADFGLAKQLGGAATLTPPGALAGTPSYMAPEQVQARSTAIGPATDVYALGAVLYELLGGRPPFLGASPLETLTQVLLEEPVPPRRLVSGVPRDLETICLKCLQKDWRRRYGTAEALADDLDRFRAGQPVRARPIGVLERAGKWVRRQPIAALSIVLVLAVTLTGFGLVLWKWLDEAEARAAAEQAETESKAALVRESKARQEVQDALASATAAERQADNARQAETRAKMELQIRLDRATAETYAYSIALAQRDVQEGALPHAAQTLASCPLHLRHWEHRYLSDLCREQVRLVGHLQSAIQGLAYTPAGQLQSLSGDQTYRLWNTSEAKEVGQRPQAVNGPAVFSADGTLMATCDKQLDLQVLETATGKVVVTLPADARASYTAAFSADTRMLATHATRSGGAIFVWQLPAGKLLHKLTGHKDRVEGLAFDADGKRLASTSLDRTVRLWDLDKGAGLRTFSVHKTFAFCVGFSPNGKLLASGGHDEKLVLYDLGGLNGNVALHAPTRGLKQLAFQPGDGNLLATGSQDGSVQIWNPQTGVLLRSFKIHKSGVNCLVFRKDGKQIATADQDTWVWDLSGDKDGLRLWRSQDRLTALAFQADGKRLVLGGKGTDNRAHVFDAGAGNLVRDLPVQPGGVTCLACCAKGKYLAIGSSQGSATVYFQGTADVALKQTGHDGGVVSLAFDADGTRLAVGCGDGKIKVWNLATGALEVAFTEHREAVHAILFTPEGDRILSCSDDRPPLVWLARSGKVVERLPVGKVRTLALSGDGEQLATGGEDAIHLWHGKTLAKGLALQKHTRAVRGLSFSPDGKRLASAGDDRTLRLWDVPTGQEVFTFPTFAEPVVAVQFSVDGKRLAAASGNSVTVWTAP